MMAVWSQIALNKIHKDRFDAEFFRPDYLKSIEKLEATGKCTPLLNLFLSIRRGMQPRYASVGDIPVLRSVNVGFMKFNDTRQEYVDRSFFEINECGRVQKDDVIITSTGVGTLGRTSIWYTNSMAFCDGHLTVLRNPSISPYLIAVFLNCKYGLSQLERHYRGSSGQIEIYPFDIGKIIIPNILFSYQDEIERIVKSYFESLILSKQSLASAHHRLESELGLDKLNFQKPMGYMARFTELEQSRRADPEHFYPEFKNLVANLPGHIELSPLGPQLTFCRRGKQPVYCEKGLPVINSKHVQNNKVVFEDNRTALPNPDSELQIRFGDILMNGTGRGTLGRVAPYLTDSQSVPDNHVTILRSPKLDPAYLSFYLNSRAGQLQVEMHQRGTSGQIELYPFDIRKFLVWVAPDSFQREIRELYNQSDASERQSKALLDQAKSRVEQLIEEAAE